MLSDEHIESAQNHQTISTFSWFAIYITVFCKIKDSLQLP